MNAAGLWADLDERLLEAARGGSDAAFGRLVARHQQPVRAFLRRLGGDVDEADDIAQETFLAAWRGLHQFRGQSSLRSWLCGIAYRKRLTRRKGQARAWEREAAFAGLTAGEESLSSDERLDLARAMVELPIEQRAVVSLCLAGGFSHSEAAAALHLPLGTVKSHLTRGRAKLMQALSLEDGEHDRS